MGLLLDWLIGPIVQLVLEHAGRLRVVSRPLGPVGRRLQRARARRLAARGRVPSVLFDRARPTVMPTPQLRGALEVSEGRLRLRHVELRVTGVDLPGEDGPGEVPSAGDLWFRPPSRVLTLHTPHGTVRWAVPAWQADWAVSRLGLAANETDGSGATRQ